MKNLLLYENFKNYSGRNEGPDRIPLYNQNKIAKPEIKLSRNEVFDEIRSLLLKKEKGLISEVNVVADVPTQGKRAPEYVKDIINRERELNKKRGYSQDKGFDNPNSFKNYPQLPNLPKDVKIHLDNTTPNNFSIISSKNSPQQIQRIINKYGYDSYGTIKKQFNESREYNLDASGNILDKYGNIRTIFFDSEYIVVDTEIKGVKKFVIGIPKSLEKEGIEVRIPPDKIIEIFYKN